MQDSFLSTGERDVWGHLAVHFLDFEEVCNLREVSKSVYGLFSEPSFERELACGFARRVMKDDSFWKRAQERPPSTSRPLPTMHMEMVRLNRFMKGYNMIIGEPATAKDIYELWKYVDSPQQ